MGQFSPGRGQPHKVEHYPLTAVGFSLFLGDYPILCDVENTGIGNGQRDDTWGQRL